MKEKEKNGDKDHWFKATEYAPEIEQERDRLVQTWDKKDKNGGREVLRGKEGRKKKRYQAMERNQQELENLMTIEIVGRERNRAR